MSQNVEQAKTEDSSNLIEVVCLTVNLFCFVVYTALALKLHSALRGIEMDKRTKTLIKVYVIIFLVKCIIWSINLITHTTNITKWL